METYYIDDMTIARDLARKLAQKRHMPHYIVKWPRGLEVVSQIDMYYNKMSDSEKIAQEG